MLSSSTKIKPKKLKSKKLKAALASAGSSTSPKPAEAKVSEQPPVEPAEEPEEDLFAMTAESMAQHGSSRRLHDGRGGKSTTAGNAASESVVINTREQAFAINFHPSEKLLVTGLITGQLKVYDYSGAQPSRQASSRPHRGACRAVKFSQYGAGIFSGSSDCTLQLRDLASNKPSWKQKEAHGEPVNALVLAGPNGVATGDDGGAVKLWDVRQRTVALAFFEHSDLVNDLLYVDAADGPTLCVASGDGCLSVFDLRKGRLAALSDCQEDELLSLALMKGGKKLLVGCQSGVVGLFSWGRWGDVSDRLLGHPESVDAMVPLNDDVLLSGSSDGLVRVVGVHPNRVLGLVGEHAADDEGLPIESMAMSAGGDVLGSISHDTTVRLWDIGYLHELRHMHRRKGAKDDEDEDDEGDEEADVEGAGEGEEDEDEDQEEVAPASRKKVKPLKHGHAAIKMTSDFFSDM